MAPVQVERDGGVLVVRLSRAERRNAISLELATAMGDAFADAGDAGAIALLADGDHFCVGGDVPAMAAADDPGEFVRTLAHEFHRTIRSMRSGIPVVVGARGWAAGAGMSMVLAGDIAVVGESSSLQPAYPGIGVTPDGGMSWTLPRIVGQRRATAILLRNEALPAARALALGLVDEVVPDAEVDTTALSIARALADGPRGALTAAKRLVRDGGLRTLEEHLDFEAESIARCADSPDGREGVAAFSERRRPEFAH